MVRAAGEGTKKVLLDSLRRVALRLDTSFADKKWLGDGESTVCNGRSWSKFRLYSRFVWREELPPIRGASRATRLAIDLFFRARESLMFRFVKAGAGESRGTLSCLKCFFFVSCIIEMCYFIALFLIKTSGTQTSVSLISNLCRTLLDVYATEKPRQLKVCLLDQVLSSRNLAQLYVSPKDEAGPELGEIELEALDPLRHLVCGLRQTGHQRRLVVPVCFRCGALRVNRIHVSIHGLHHQRYFGISTSSSFYSGHYGMWWYLPLSEKDEYRHESGADVEKAPASPD